MAIKVIAQRREVKLGKKPGKDSSLRVAKAADLTLATK